ncbi:MAG: RNA methyltransferase [Ferrovum sp.]|nr:RNA methyltransferase [Ferrovum sp.]NDU86923.1 RNA methyltransferase [Ferrovum sp.]
MSSVVASHPVLRHWAHLRESAHQRRRERMTVLEGIHLLQVYLAQGGVPKGWLMAESACYHPEVCALHPPFAWPKPLRVADALFEKISSIQASVGVVALIDWPEPASSLPDCEPCLVLAGLQDPGNVGTLFRSARAAGMEHVVLAVGSAQAWAPKVLRAAMGAHFHLRIHESVVLESWLPQYQGQILGMDRELSQRYDRLDLTGTVALIVGNEGAGLPASVSQHLHQRIHIPMASGVESLNAAVAGSVVLFERQRQEHVRVEKISGDGI